MTDQARQDRRNWLVFLIGGLYLIAQAPYRFFVRAGEWPSPLQRNIEIGLDIVLSAAVVALFFQLRKALPATDGKRTLSVVLIIGATAAMLVIFGIRFSSAVGWATGHRLNWSG